MTTSFSVTKTAPRLGVALAACLVMALVAGSARAEDKVVHKYIGVAKCKMCHNSAKSGMQFKVWTESKHSQAYTALASDKAKAIAADKKIADPQKAAECIKCHVTGAGLAADSVTAALKPEDGVQCEVCHGPGSEYKKDSVMKGIRAGTMKAEDYGLQLPTKETCVKCHNSDSPTFKSFDWAADSAKIAHPVPKAAG